MNKTNSTLSTVSHITLLAYSTWLVVGIWLIFTGAELIYKTSNGNDSSFNYLFGALRFLVGVNALRTAPTAAQKSGEPLGLSFKVLTYLLLILLVGLPFLVLIYQISKILFGTFQPDKLYRETAVRLLIVGVCYLFATFFADWRLRK